jgi:hypothetical protein
MAANEGNLKSQTVKTPKNDKEARHRYDLRSRDEKRDEAASGAGVVASPGRPGGGTGAATDKIFREVDKSSSESEDEESEGEESADERKAEYQSAEEDATPSASSSRSSRSSSQMRDAPREQQHDDARSPRMTYSLPDQPSHKPGSQLEAGRDQAHHHHRHASEGEQPPKLVAEKPIGSRTAVSTRARVETALLDQRRDQPPFYDRDYMSWEELEAYRNIHEMFRRKSTARESNFPPRVEEPTDRWEPPGSRGTEPVVCGGQAGPGKVPRLFVDEPDRLTGVAGRIRDSNIHVASPR